MQETRQQILTILKEKGSATVDTLATSLNLTPITVRHHLSILLGEGYLAAQQVRRKVGRPHYVYSLTEKASDVFPQGYHLLTDRLLDELKIMVGQEGMEALLARLADRLAANIAPQVNGDSVEDRLNQAARILVNEGFLARWEKTADGYIFYELNCPYRRVIHHHPEVCSMDQRFLSEVLNIGVEKIDCIVAGGERCTYRVQAAHQGQPLSTSS
jgi:predicted ArsR family transcriptional regulator